jgi:hypothetical protein
MAEKVRLQLEALLTDPPRPATTRYRPTQALAR